MTNSVLITGAAGLIGRRLTEVLLQKGCRVSHLGRTKRVGPVPSFVWNLERGTVEDGAFEGIDTIIHLAGAGIADKRWSGSVKKEILESRIKSTDLLYTQLKSKAHSVRTIVGASAIGYYGFGLRNDLLTEESPPGKDYLAGVVVNWEKEVDRLELLRIRVVKIRIGIVLSEQGGALKELARPIRWGIGSAMGTGRQLVSWIHIDDLSEMFILAVQRETMRGTFNGTAPVPVTNFELTEAIARTLHRKILLPNIPSAAMHLIIGEMADLVLFGSNVSSHKMQQTGFEFQYPELLPALRNLLAK